MLPCIHLLTHLHPRCRGFLKKRSSNKGLQKWQIRWFELTIHRLAYWEVAADGAVDARGSFALREIVDVLPHHRNVLRFHLKLRSGRVVWLCAPSTGDREVWLSSLRDALRDAALSRPSPEAALKDIAAKYVYPEQDVFSQLSSASVSPHSECRSRNMSKLGNLYNLQTQANSKVNAGEACQEVAEPNASCELSRECESLDLIFSSTRLSSDSTPCDSLLRRSPSFAEREPHQVGGEEEEGADGDDGEEGSTVGSSYSLSKSDSSTSSFSAMRTSLSSPNCSFNSASAMPDETEPMAHVGHASNVEIDMGEALLSPRSREVQLQALEVAAYMSRIERSRKTVSGSSCREINVAAAA